MFIAPDLPPKPVIIIYTDAESSSSVVAKIQQQLFSIDSSGSMLTIIEKEESSSSIPAWEQITFIRNTLEIPLTKLAGIFMLSRQAIYKWKDGAESPSSINISKINYLYEFAKTWSNITAKSLRRHIEYKANESDLSLYELLSRLTPINSDLLKEKITLVARIVEREDANLTKLKETGRRENLRDFIEGDAIKII